MMMRLLLILLFCSLPYSVWAAGAFQVSGLDRSMEYLGTIFGPMGTMLVSSTGNDAFAAMIQIMNKIVFFLGIIIVIYTALVSTIHTAQQGEVMGKKWSTIWVPIRALFGLFLLLPSPSSGYAYIQIFVMYLISHGVGAANAIWERVLNGLLEGETLQAQTNPAEEVELDMNALYGLVKAELCRYAINSNPQYLELLNDEPITHFRWGDALIWGTESNQVAICGQILIPSFSNIIDPVEEIIGGGPKLDQTPLKNIYARTIEGINYLTEPIAQEAFTEPSSANRTMVANLTLVARDLKRATNRINSYYQYLNKKDELAEAAKLEGWIHAGSYYFLLVTGIAKSESKKPVAFAYEGPKLDTFLPQNDVALLTTDINKKAAETFLQARNLLGTKPTRTELAGGLVIKSSSSAGIPGWDDVFGDLFKKIAIAIMESISGNSERDPLISISKAGTTIMQTVEISFYVSVVLLGVLTAASVPPCANPVWGVMATVTIIFAGLFLLVGSLLWTAGVIMGLYVPLIPWLVFTFSAIGWIILVIEAIVAAPLIALVLIVPSEDEIGKAGHSLVILIGLIFRPALMIIGFIAGAKVMFVAISMLNYGFKEMIMANVHGIGLFGSIGIIVFYVSTVLIVIHQSFSLIYMLPDRVMRWMGGHPEGEDVMSKVGQIKGSAQKGAGIGSGLMKGAAGIGFQRAASKTMGKKG